MKTLLTAFMSLSIFVATPLIGAVKEDSPKTISGAVTVDASEAKKLFDEEVMFIDVRKDKDWRVGRIPGAEHIEFKKKFNEKSLGEFVKKDQMLVIYCNGPKGLNSSKASAKAVEWGFEKVRYFRGGLPAWKVAKYPVE